MRRLFLSRNIEGAIFPCVAGQGCVRVALFVALVMAFVVVVARWLTRKSAAVWTAAHDRSIDPRAAGRLLGGEGGGDPRLLPGQQEVTLNALNTLSRAGAPE
jgi:hypothetical protein